MSASFNPFETWLGLPPELENPNYFELLAIDPDCDNEASIRAAAKRQLAKIRAIRPGEQARQWTELIDRLGAAEKCLCDQASRAEYREGLVQTTVESTAAWQPPPANEQPPADEIPTALPTAVPLPQTADELPEQGSDSASSEDINQPAPPPVPPPAPEKTAPGVTPESYLNQHGGGAQESFDVTQNRTPGKSRPRQRNKRGCLILMIGQVVIALIAILFAVWLMSDESRIAKLKQGLGMGATADDESDDEKDRKNDHQKDPNKNDLKSDVKKNKSNTVDKKKDKPDGKGKQKDKQADKKSKTDPDEGKQKTKTGNGKNDTKLPAQTNKINGKSDEPSQLNYDTLTPAFRFYCRYALQNLELRHFDHAKFAILHLQKLDLNESETIINSRLLAVNEAFESFWQTVETYSMRVAAGDQIFLEGRPEPVGIVEADKSRVVFRTGGENRRYETRQLPNLVAEAFATRQLGTGATDLKLQIAVFRGSHFFRDPKFRLQAVDQLKRLTDQTDEVLPLIKFFEDDLPEISKIQSTSVPEAEQIKARSKEIEIAAGLVQKRKVDPAFWDKSFTVDDAVEQKARLQLAIKYLSRNGDSTAVSLFDFSELRFGQKDSESVMLLVRTFQPNRRPHDTGALIEWALGKLEDPGYRWKPNQNRQVRKNLLLAATKSGLANQARKIENLADPK